MDDYLAKPIELNTLRQALARCQPLPPSPIDHGRIADLGSELGDPALVVELLEIFRRNAPEFVATVPAAMSRGDSDEARRAVHTLRSNAAQFGAEELAEACRVAEEELITSGYTGQAEAIASALDSVLVAVDEALDGRVRDMGQAATS